MKYSDEVGRIRIPDWSVRGFFARYSLRVMREAYCGGAAGFIRYKGEDANN